jgi:hypothetical protein
VNKWIRQTHRWLSIVFTVTVIANFVALSQGTPPDWVTYSPLLPLALLLFSGLYLLCCRIRPRGAAGEAPNGWRMIVAKKQAKPTADAIGARTR